MGSCKLAGPVLLHALQCCHAVHRAGQKEYVNTIMFTNLKIVLYKLDVL
jgi:hypothetical protein